MTIPDRLYIPLTALEGYHEKAPRLEFEGAYVGDESETYVRESAIWNDPALKQVMEALEGSIETAAMVASDLRRKAQHPQFEMNASSLEANNREARAAIVTLRERMGGMDA